MLSKAEWQDEEGACCNLWVLLLACLPRQGILSHVDRQTSLFG